MFLLVSLSVLYQYRVCLCLCLCPVLVAFPSCLYRFLAVSAVFQCLVSCFCFPLPPSRVPRFVICAPLPGCLLFCCFVPHSSVCVDSASWKSHPPSFSSMRTTTPCRLRYLSSTVLVDVPLVHIYTSPVRVRYRLLVNIFPNDNLCSN